MDKTNRPANQPATQKENTMTKAEKNIARCRDMSNGTREDIRELAHIVNALADRLQSKATDNALAGKADWSLAGSLGFIKDQLLDTLDGFNALMTREELEAATRILDVKHGRIER